MDAHRPFGNESLTAQRPACLHIQDAIVAGREQLRAECRRLRLALTPCTGAPNR